MEDFLTGIINGGYSVWNFIIHDIVLELLAMNPEGFNEGSGWTVITSINEIFVAVGATLVVLFFLIGFCSNSMDVKEEMRLEVILRVFIRLSIAEYFVTHSLEIVQSLFQSVTALTGLINDQIGSIAELSIPENIMECIDDMGFIMSLVMCIPAIIFFIAIVAAAGMIVYQAYFRFFKVLIIVPYGSLAFSTLGGDSPALRGVPGSFVKYLLATLLEAVSMILALALCCVVASSEDGVLGLVSNLNPEDWLAVLMYMVESLFTVLLTVGSVKGSQSIAERALNLR